MPEWTINIGHPHAVSPQRIVWNAFNPNPGPIDTALVDGAAAAYVGLIAIWKPSTGAACVFQLSPTSASGFGGADGPDLTTGWEASGTITLATGSVTPLTIGPPSNSNLGVIDTTEPYNWYPPNVSEINAYIASVVATATRGTTLTIRGPVSENRLRSRASGTLPRLSGSARLHGRMQVVPSRPIAPTLTVRTNGDIYAESTRPFDGNSPLTGFDWRIREVGASAWTNERFVQVDWTFRRLRRDKDHEIQVRAVNRIGRSDWSPSAIGRRAPRVRRVKASAVLPSLQGTAGIGSPLVLADFDGSRLSPPIVLGLISAGAQSSGTMYRQQTGQPRIGTFVPGSDLALRRNQDVTRIAVFSNGADMRLWDNPSGQHLSTLFTETAGYNVYIQTKAGVAKLTRGSQGGNFSNWNTAVASEQAILRSLLVTGSRFIIAIATILPVRYARAAATLPTLAGSARASRLVPVMRDVRAAATLPAITSSARATRIVPAARSARAAGTLPAISGQAKATRTSAEARKVKASGVLPAPSGSGRIKRFTASARKVKAAGGLPSLVGTAKSSFVRSPIRKVRAAGTLPSLTGTARTADPVTALHLADFDASRLAPPIVLGLITTGAQSGGTMYRAPAHPASTLGTLATGSDMLLQGTQFITRIAVFSNGGEMRLWDNPSGDHFSTLFTVAAGYNVYVQTLAGVAMLTRGPQGGNFSRWTTTDSDERAILRSLLTTGTQFIIAAATQPIVRHIRAPATLPAIASSARATRLGTAIRAARAAATLPALVGRARASRIATAIRSIRAAGILPSLAASARTGAPRAGLHLSDFDDTGLEPPIVLGLITTGVTTPAGTSSTVYLTIGGIHYLGSLAPGSDITLQEDQTITRLAVYTNGDQLQIWAASVLHDMASLFPSNTRYNVYIQTSAGLAVLDRGAQSGSSSLWTTTTADEQAIVRSLLTRGTEFLIAVARQPGVRLVSASATLPVVTASVKASRILPVVRDVRASAALPALVGKATAARISTAIRSIRAIATLPALTGTARAIRIITVRSVRASASLQALAGSVRTTRTETVARNVKASGVLPSLSGRGSLRHFTATARHVRASAELPSLSGRGRIRRFTASARRVKASAVLPSPRGVARIKRTLATLRRVKASATLPRIDGSARSRLDRFVARQVRASGVLPALTGVARLVRDIAPVVPSTPNAPALAAFSRRTIQAKVTPPNDGGSPIASYDWRYRVLRTGAWNDLLREAGTTVNIFSLLPSTTYEVQVRATNSIGSSGYSPSARQGTLAPVGITKQAVPRYKLLIDFNNVGSFDISKFVDIWEDVQQANCFTGREMQGQGRRGPIVGQLNATLNNIEGKYIKQNFASPYFDRIHPGIRAVLQMNLPQNPLDYVDIWCGFLDDVSVDIKLEPSLAQLKAFGALGVISTEEISSHIYYASATGTNNPNRVNVDKLVLDAFAAADWPVAERLIGTTSAAVKFPSFRGETPRNEIADLELHELGRLWESKNSIEVLHFTGESYRYSGNNRKVRMTYRNNEAKAGRLRDVVYTALPTPLTTTDADRAYIIYTTGEPREPAKDVYNVISGTYGDRNFDWSSAGKVICYQSNNEYEIAAQSVFLLNQAPSVAPPILWITSLTKGASNGGYKVSRTSGGRHSSSLAARVTVSSRSDRLYATITNQTNSAVFVRDISVYGRQLVRSENIISVRDNTSILRYQTKPLTLDLRYVETAGQCRDLLNTLLGTYAEPRLTYDVKYDAWADYTSWYNASHVEHSQRVDFAAVKQNLQDTCFIEKVSHSINPRTGHVVDLTLSASDQDTNSSIDGVIILDLGPNLDTGVLGR